MTQLKPTITRWQGMGLMATTLLGTGVFILPQLTLNQAGDKAPLTWILLTLAILPLALVFAELGRRYPSAAGPAFFVQEAFGKRYGYVIGLMFLMVVPMGAPAALMITFEFLKPLVQLTPLQALLGQLAILGFYLALNWRGLQVSGRAQLGLTLAIVAVVVAMLIALSLKPIQVPPIASGNTSGMFAAMGLALWSFLGIEAITHLSAEFRQPEHDFVPAVLGGTVLVGLIYTACTYLSLLAPTAPLAMVGAYEQLLGSSGRWVIGILGIASGLATVNVYFASIARLAWSLSQQGVLPAFLRPLNAYHIPGVALITVTLFLASTLIIAYGLGENFEPMVRWTNGVFVFIYTASMLAAWRLLAKRYRPAIVMGLIVCVLFALSLGGAMLYGLLLAVVFTLLVNIQRRWCAS